MVQESEVSWSRLRVGASVAGVLLLSGCHTLSPTLQQGAAAYAITGIPSQSVPESQYKIFPGDALTVNVLYEPDVSLASAKVDSNGDIQLPLIGNLHVAGRTVQDVASYVETRLGAHYLRNPRVTVNVASFSRQNVTVEGQVIHPGVYDIPNSSTLLQTLALAQGPTRVAALNQVIVFRTVDGRRMGGVFDVRRIRYGYEPDPTILAGDVVVVGFSEVKGAFRDFLTAAPAFAGFRPY